MTEIHDRNNTAEVVKERGRTGTDEPSLYKVLLHNDNYTSMDFVVIILEKVFGKSTAQATRIMLQVHHEVLASPGSIPGKSPRQKFLLSMIWREKMSFPSNVPWKKRKMWLE